MKSLFIGTSGFYYKHWRRSFYPEDLKSTQYLRFYSQHFNTVEINSTFYHLPRSATVQNWKAQVSSDFLFSFKASRFITHIKKLNVKAETLQRFLQPLKIFAQKKASHLILFQTPSFLSQNKERLANLLQILPKTFLYAFEFRHQSWFTEEIYQILRKYNASTVLTDSPLKEDGSPLWPKVAVETANFFYLRFHGAKRLYASSYTDEELSHYADLIKEKLKRGLSVFAYFNNDAQAAAIPNAQRLNSLLQSD